MKTLVSAAFGAVLLAGPALAVPTTFYGEDSSPVLGFPISNIPNAQAAEAAFLAALEDTWRYDEEVDQPGQFDTANLIGPGNVTADFQPDAAYAQGTLGGGTFYAFDGVNVIYGEGFGLVNFSRAMNGVGVYAISNNPDEPVAGRTPAIRFQITWSDGAVEEFFSPATSDSELVQFFGVIDPDRTFTELFIDSPADNIFVGQMDILQFGVVAAPVPAPAAAGLALFGLAALGFRRRSAAPA